MMYRRAQACSDCVHGGCMAGGSRVCRTPPEVPLPQSRAQAPGAGTPAARRGPEVSTARGRGAVFCDGRLIARSGTPAVERRKPAASGGWHGLRRVTAGRRSMIRATPWGAFNKHASLGSKECGSFREGPPSCTTLPGPFDLSSPRLWAARSIVLLRGILCAGIRGTAPGWRLEERRGLSPRPLERS